MREISQNAISRPLPRRRSDGGKLHRAVHQGRRQFRRSGRQSSASGRTVLSAMKVSYRGRWYGSRERRQAGSFHHRLSHAWQWQDRHQRAERARHAADVVSLSNQINAMGISRDRILVASHDAATGGSQVELNYISYRPAPPPAATGRRTLPSPPTTRPPPISAAPSSTISPPWWPIRAICWDRARWTAPMRRAVRR